MHKNSLAVGLCTFKRPVQLQRCLLSLQELERPAAAALCIIIADNDPSGSAEPVVKSFRRTCDIPVYYSVEAQRGIPFARNKILNKAKQLGITELAFIDDDEYAEPSWLVRLWEYYSSSGVDVVRGPVKTVYPPGTPEWILKGGFHQSSVHATGTVCDWAATNNVLFNFQKIVIEQNLMFDIRFGLTGLGEDEDFFRRAHHKGAIIHCVENAVVHEELARDRMSLSYYLKRKWCIKNTLLIPPRNHAQWRTAFIKQCRKLVWAGVLLTVSWRSGKHVAFGRLGDAVAATAKIAALLGIDIKWEEFK